MRNKCIRAALALVSLTVSGVALANPGHPGGAMAGLLHPLVGPDHLLAMAAVGVWAAQIGGRAKWLVPASFVALMAASAGLAMAGVALPMVESGIATSVLLLGLLIAFAVKVTPALGATIVGLFSVFHGYAHGSEMPAMSTAWQYGLGFVASTALLHALGVAAGGSLRQQGLWLRAAGAAVAASGAWMIATV